MATNRVYGRLLSLGLVGDRAPHSHHSTRLTPPHLEGHGGRDEHVPVGDVLLKHQAEGAVPPPHADPRLAALLPKRHTPLSSAVALSGALEAPRPL
eukprot:1736054-Pyramimonas_sp.AAC.1